MQTCAFFLRMNLLIGLISIVLTFPSSLLSEGNNFVSANETKVLVSITFHYVDKRLGYLGQVLEGLEAFPHVDVIIITNTIDSDEINAIRSTWNQGRSSNDKGMNVSVRSFPHLDHPFNLTWCHKPIISDEFLNDSAYTHFIYLEDDIRINIGNFCYFLEYREQLKPFGLIPSFLRVEYRNKCRHFVNTDNTSSIEILKHPHLDLGEYVFVNVPNPYHACFILDKELAEEYIQTRSFDRLQSKFCAWDTRERAAMGLCFEHIPQGFTSRYVVPVKQFPKIAPLFTWIFHLPNNYANSESSFGKIPMETLFY